MTKEKTKPEENSVGKFFSGLKLFLLAEGLGATA
jgi:hypothetical protein